MSGIVPYPVGSFQSKILGMSPQNDNVLFAQSRNVLLTPSRLERWQKDNY
jgi:hypothetical protein